MTYTIYCVKVIYYKITGVGLKLAKKSVTEIRNSKPFYPFDLIIYCALIFAVIGTLFIVFFAGKTAENQGVYIILDNSTIAEYRFGGDKFTVLDGYENYFSAKDDGIYFYPDGNSHERYNLIIIDGENETVYIKDATCAGHDCERQKITENGGFIYCAPHKLKIVPMKLSDPVSG